MEMSNLILTFRIDRDVNRVAPKFRGFIARKFPDFLLLHQHNGKNLIYLYPWVQYKVINGLLMIVGISEGLEPLKEIYLNLEYVELEKNRHRILEKTMKETVIQFGANASFHRYNFLTPWLSLNERNYEKYQTLRSQRAKTEVLEKILIGNIISMSKGLGYTVPAPIRANILKIKELQTFLKGTPMLGFLGTFSVNFEIPDYWGIGKSVSRGFGTVKRIEKRGEKLRN